MNWTETAMISCIYFLFLFSKVSGLPVNKHLHCFPQMYDDTFNLLGIQGGGDVLPLHEQSFFVISETAQ